MIATTAIGIASLIANLIGQGTSIANAKKQANAQLQANQDAINQQNVNNIINNNNQLQQQYNSNDYNDMYKDRVSMLRCGGKKKKAQLGTKVNMVPNNTVQYIDRSDYLKCGGNRKMKCGGRK